MAPIKTILASALMATMLASCGGSSSSGDTGGGNNFRTQANVKHAVVGQPALENTLKRCIFKPIRDGDNSFCRLNELSLIADIRPGNPTVDDIMSRTLVSHDWMAARLRQALNSMPAESLQLFNAVTGIIVAFDLRPSFYNSGTAAVYIDPYYLFVTQAERDTVDDSRDFRSDFDKDLQYDFFFRYMIGTERAYRFFPPNGESRTATELKYIFSRLIFHELAHANDFQPPSQHATLKRSDTPLENSQDHRSRWISNEDGYNMSSQIMFGLAEVKFEGDSPNAQQRSYTAADIGTQMDQEPVNHDYQYFSQFEDVAMLTEAALMDYFYGVEFESAALDRATQQIAWGKRKRIAKPNVRRKTEEILSRMMPDSDFTAFFASLSTEQDLPHGRTWQETNSASSSANPPKSKSLVSPSADQDPFIH